MSEHKTKDTIEGDAATWVQDARWWDALTEAITPATMAYVRAYARTLLRSGASAFCDETAAQLADAALSETALGAGRWDPARGPLAPFLCGRVRRYLAAQRPAARRTVRIDYVSDGDPEGAAVERALTHDAQTPARLASRAMATAVLAELRTQLQDDDAATAYVAARLAGHEGRTEVAAATGLTIAAVRAAHMRVVRCARALSPTLHEDVAARLLAPTRRIR